MKRLFPFLFVMSLFSCTSLQYRRTDTEIINTFKNQGVKTEFLYHNIDSLNLKIRVQKVSNTNSDFNILFIHGSPSSLSAWQAYLLDNDLISNANLYAIDRPGYGYTSFGKAMPSIADQALMINRLLKELNLKNIIIVGSSYGGPIGARIAFINEDVNGIIMISAAIDPNIEKDIWASRFTQWKLTRWLVPTGYRVAGDEKVVHASELKKIEKDWSVIKTPVLHLHGDIDGIVPVENLQYTDSIFTNASIKYFSGIDHDLAWRHHNLVKLEILSFLKELNDTKAD